MADMYGAVRSNYFQVKDPVAFKKFFGENCYFGSEIQLWEDDCNQFAFGGYEQYPSAWPRYPADEEDQYWDGEREWDLKEFAEEFRKHLAEGHTLEVVAAGNEKLRYVAAQRLRIGEAFEDFSDWYAGN